MTGRRMTGCTLEATKEKEPLTRSLYAPLPPLDVLLQQHEHNARGPPLMTEDPGARGFSTCCVDTWIYVERWVHRPVTGDVSSSRNSS